MAAANAHRWICFTRPLPRARAGIVSTPRDSLNTIRGSAGWSANFSTASLGISMLSTRTSRLSFMLETALRPNHKSNLLCRKAKSSSWIVTLVRILPIKPLASRQRNARSYTTAKQDILEASLRHLELAADMYDLLSREAPWVPIQCFDAARGEMRPPKQIAQEVLAAVEPVIFTQAVRDPGQSG